VNLPDRVLVREVFGFCEPGAQLVYAMGTCRGESIRLHDKLLLILSEHSVRSTWVHDEVEAAPERERREHRLVLFPIRIDDAVMETEQAWAASIRRMRHIGDFTRWKEHDHYQRGLERLLRDLKAEGVKDGK